MSIEHSPTRIGHKQGPRFEPDAARQTLTITEVAKVLGIGRNQAYEAARSGQIPVIRIGKRMLVPCAAIERMLRGEAA